MSTTTRVGQHLHSGVSHSEHLHSTSFKIACEPSTLAPDAAVTVPETVMRLLLGDWAPVAAMKKMTKPNTDKTGTLIRALLLILRDDSGCCGDVQLNGHSPPTKEIAWNRGGIPH